MTQLKLSRNSEAYALEFLENLEKCFICTTGKVISVADTNYQSHYFVLFKQFIICTKSLYFKKHILFLNQLSDASSKHFCDNSLIRE